MRRTLLWIVALAAPVVLVLAGAVTLDVWARWHLAARLPTDDLTLLDAGAPGDVEAGRRLYQTVANCQECHGPDGAGSLAIDDGFVGRLVAPDLTGGGHTPASFDLSVRHGLDPEGRALVLMPSDGYAALSDSDLRDLLAYVQSLPPSGHTLPESALGIGGRQLVLWGELHVPARLIDHDAVGGPADMPAGEYLARVSGCYGCHGPDLQGRTLGPSLPPAPPIGGDALKSWSEVDFQRALREGVRPDGGELDPTMPWPALSRLDDDELHDLWLVVRAPR